MKKCLIAMMFLVSPAFAQDKPSNYMAIKNPERWQFEPLPKDVSILPVLAEKPKGLLENSQPETWIPLTEIKK